MYPDAADGYRCFEEWPFNTKDELVLLLGMHMLKVLQTVHFSEIHPFLGNENPQILLQLKYCLWFFNIYVSDFNVLCKHQLFDTQ